MTVPAFAFFWTWEADHVEMGRVASQAVGLDYGYGAFGQAEDLRLGPGGKSVGMLYTVHSLEGELCDGIAVWYVTIDADGDFSVATALP
jgi:hypothetical protein